MTEQRTLTVAMLYTPELTVRPAEVELPQGLDDSIKLVPYVDDASPHTDESLCQLRQVFFKAEVVLIQDGLVSVDEDNRITDFSRSELLAHAHTSWVVSSAMQRLSIFSSYGHIVCDSVRV